jgi:hypothetical protein
MTIMKEYVWTVYVNLPLDVVILVGLLLWEDSDCQGLHISESTPDSHTRKPVL